MSTPFSADFSPYSRRRPPPGHTSGRSRGLPRGTLTRGGRRRPRRGNGAGAGNRRPGDRRAHLHGLSSAPLKRAVERAAEVRQACVSAREQQVAARRLAVRLDAETGDELHSDARSRPSSVLVVDDAADVREVVAEVLRQAGFVVRTAANGLEALLAAYEMHPCVILMDLTMPVLDGIAATRLIKATEAIRHAHVIAHTGIRRFLTHWFSDCSPRY